MEKSKVSLSKKDLEKNLMQLFIDESTNKIFTNKSNIHHFYTE